MKVININDFEEKLYYEKLNNGLEVFLVPLLNKKDYFVSMGIKYGNSYTDFKVDNKNYQVPSGIAHFLEHKLFERNEILKPFEFFLASGTDVNASTSISFTNYYFAGNNNFENNLKYFLNWLTKLEINDSLVEKEKGIILQEARMYDDDIDRFLYEEIRHNTFINDSYGKKVIGEDCDIKNITKKDLELCYSSFYRPDNMFLVITGCFDKDKTIKIIEQELIDFKNSKFKVNKIKIKEPDEVLLKEQTYKKDLTTPKVAISYKINKNKFPIEEYKLDIYLSIILSLVFGNTSIFREESLNTGVFLTFFSSIISSSTHKVIILDGITNNPDKFIKKVDEEIRNIRLKEEDFNRIKKAWIAGEIKTIDNVNMINHDIFTDIITYEEYKNNKINDLKALNFKELNTVIKSLSFKNRAIIKILPLK